ncbi:MAG: hypothetical protein AB7S69_01305 [Salinivirgaceae bacterium]
MKALVCITTCRRINEVKKNIIPFLRFVNSNSSYDFLLALDGTEKEYLEFCQKFNIPLLYSKAREGVGLSKNRVLKRFPDYNYYFFIEDDVEIINTIIFDSHINISLSEKLPHLTCATIIQKRVVDKKKIKNEIITKATSAGAYFNFFTKAGLEMVGGWHTLFAKYRRFGHTEHSLRFFHLKLIPAPFIVTESLRKHLILNNPPHVTSLNIDQNENELIPEEQAMIDAKQSYFPLTTLSAFYFNGFDVSIPDLHPDLQKGRYALLKGRDKIKAWGNFYFHKFKASGNPFYLIIALFLYPTNNLLKHWVKQVIKV